MTHIYELFALCFVAGVALPFAIITYQFFKDSK